MGFFDLFKKKTDKPAEQTTTPVAEQTQEAKDASKAAEEAAGGEKAEAKEAVEAAETVAVTEPTPEQAQQELNAGLEKTKTGFFSKLARAIAGRSTVDADVLDDLEEVLITSDVGVETTLTIVKRVEERVARDKYVNTDELNNILRDEIASLLTENNTTDTEGYEIPEGKKPYVIMVVGVNGVGKTTTIGKLAYQFKKAGKK